MLEGIAFYQNGAIVAEDIFVSQWFSLAKEREQ